MFFDLNVDTGCARARTHARILMLLKRVLAL